MTTTELVEAGREWGKPLTEADARALTAEIRTSVQELLPKIRTAYRRRADLALGYAGWDEYCDAELTGLRLPLGDRVEAVTTLRGDGMSQRAIGSALGISAATVNRTLAGVSDETPADRVTGTDSKSYAATRPERSPFPGPSDAAIKPPVDPGATPAPATESTAAPAAPSREPASAMPPRKPARQPSAEQAAQLPAAILAVLAEADELGLTADQIWARLPMASVHSSWVMPALHELVDAGRVVAAGEGRHGAKWALTPEPITAPPVTPPPGSPATWTDEQRAANQREIDRKRMVAAGRRAARDLVMSVRAEISTVVSAIDLGEKDLINEQVIADLRAAVDLLESRLEASK